MLRDRIIVKKPDGKQDEYGAESGNFIVIFRPACEFSVMSGTQLLKSGVELTREYASIKMRYTRKVEHDCIIEFNGGDYEVEGIKPDKRYHYMYVTVSRDKT